MPIEMLLSSAQLFMKVGVRSVSMDDVSRHLGISKKTLYQYVSNKGELIAKIVNLKVSKIEADLTEIFSKSPNALEAFVRYSQYLLENYGWMNPKVVYDLKKYYPTGWKIYDDHLEIFSFEVIKNNLSRGVKEGLFREEIEIEVVTSVFLQLMLDLFEAKKFSLEPLTRGQIMREYLTYHLYGISTLETQPQVGKLCNNL